MEGLVSKSVTSIEKNSHAALFIQHTLSGVVELFCTMLREQANEMEWAGDLVHDQYELANDLEDMCTQFCKLIKGKQIRGAWERKQRKSLGVEVVVATESR
jgi:hypothetical protein